MGKLIWTVALLSIVGVGVYLSCGCCHRKKPDTTAHRADGYFGRKILKGKFGDKVIVKVHAD